MFWNLHTLKDKRLIKWFEKLFIKNNITSATSQSDIDKEIKEYLFFYLQKEEKDRIICYLKERRNWKAPGDAMAPTIKLVEGIIGNPDDKKNIVIRSVNGLEYGDKNYKSPFKWS